MDFEALKQGYQGRQGASQMDCTLTPYKGNLHAAGAANWSGNVSEYGHYQTYSYPYISTVYVDKTQRAFTVAKLLMDKELVTCDTVNQFIELIDLLVSAI